MANYVYEREEIAPDVWNINNPYALGANQQPQTLLSLVQENMPEQNCTDVILKGITATVVIDELDGPLKEQLDALVSWHKSQTYVDVTTYTTWMSANGTNWDVYVNNDGEFQSKLTQ